MTSKREYKLPVTIGVGAVFSLIVTVLCCIIVAWLLATEKMDMSSAGYITMILTAISAIIGSFLAIKQAGKYALPVSAASGVIYWILLISVNLLLFDGMFSGLWETGLLIGGCSIAVALIWAKMDGKKIRRKRGNC